MALDKPHEMTSAIQTSASSRVLKETSICPTDQEAMVPIRSNDRDGLASTPAQKKLDKKSWDYIIRSGIAGGVAGCAVCNCLQNL
jgi:solute carrier family 25 (mitochondrial carrier protein), member 16